VSSKKDQRERVLPLAGAAFQILDEYEEDDWEWREAGKDPLDDQTAAARDADYLARLQLACENDLEVLTDVIQVWYESRRKPFDARGDEDRSSHFLRAFLGLIDGYGNLFGRFRETTPAFDPVKAAEGRRRGWRGLDRQRRRGARAARRAGGVGLERSYPCRRRLKHHRSDAYIWTASRAEPVSGSGRYADTPTSSASSS
jgi:hypothetical protein